MHESWVSDFRVLFQTIKRFQNRVCLISALKQGGKLIKLQKISPYLVCCSYNLCICILLLLIVLEGVDCLQEVGHFLAAFPKKVKLGIPFLIPNSTLGSFGAITQVGICNHCSMEIGASSYFFEFFWL